jgi:hypothetical protein
MPAAQPTKIRPTNNDAIMGFIAASFLIFTLRLWLGHLQMSANNLEFDCLHD